MVFLLLRAKKEEGGRKMKEKGGKKMGFLLVIRPEPRTRWIRLGKLVKF
jgi:hypothetical protein